MRLANPMQHFRFLFYGLALLLSGWCVPAAAPAAAADHAPAGLKAGVATVCITPERPVWMAGYGGRNKRSEGKYQDLFVKALALEDRAGHRTVIVTSDLVAVTRNWREPVLQQVKARLGLEEDQILLNCSHTHCGPVFSKLFYPEWDPDYTQELIRKTADAIAGAVANLDEARLWRGRGVCTLGVNRRKPLADDPTRVDAAILPNPHGLTDPDVHVLKVTRGDGSVKAVLFLYACHPTTMGGYLFGGDLAGFAQQFVEREFPGAVALFMQGCGGDIRP